MAEGFWGPPTSTLDWCETNYEVTYYIAEFWNTITNLSMIVPPIYGLFKAQKYNFEKRFVLSYIFLLAIGIGSWMFHMTLKYEMQLMDELPMVYACGVFIYALREVSSPRRVINWGLVYFLVAYCAAVTIVYLINKNPIFHEVMYGFLVAWMMWMDLQITRKHQTRTIITLFVVGISMYLTGFLFWNLDNQFCSSLERFREVSPAVFRPFSQFHGWWHILAGYSTYLHILANIYHRETCLGENKIIFTWDWIGVTVVPANGKAL